MRMPFSKLSKGFAAFLVFCFLLAAWQPAFADAYQTFNISGTLQSGATFSGTVQLDINPPDGVPYLANWDVTVNEATGTYYITVPNYQGTCPPGQSCVEEAALNSDGSAILLIYIDNGSDSLVGYTGGEIIPQIVAANESNSGFGYTDANGNRVTDNLVSGSLEPATQAPGIYYNGQKISGIKSPVYADVGQQIALTGIPTPDSGQTQPWNVDPNANGALVGGYTVVEGQSGQVVPLDLSGGSTTFYWTLPGRYKVTYNASKGGNLATAIFVVRAPKDVSVVPQAGVVQVLTQPQSHFENPPYFICGGNGMPCVRFNNQSTKNAGGRFQWVQTITYDNIREVFKSGEVKTCASVVGLDNLYPYPGNQKSTADSPNQHLPNNEVSNTRMFSARMYLMWTPPFDKSIPIPFGYVDWSWAGTTEHAPDGTWSQPGTTPTVGTFQSINLFPEWSVVQTNQGGGVVCTKSEKGLP